MEFYRRLKITTTENELKRSLVLSNLDKFSNVMFQLDEPSETESNIGGIWGEFTLRRSEIKGGIRFSLVECPNALCWTLTTGLPPDPESIVMHLTINREQKDQEFIDEIEEFLDDHERGIKNFFMSK